MRWLAFFAGFGCWIAGCGGMGDSSSPPADGSVPVDAPVPDSATGRGGASASKESDGSSTSLTDAIAADGAENDDGLSNEDATAHAVDAGGLAQGRFVTSVVSFTPGPCAGFGQPEMPGIVEGPPVGGGSFEGSTNVVSLGTGGTIVVSFAPNAIVDGPGPDFIVFENPFWIGGNSSDIYAEPGQVSVSDDGTNWTAFPCAPTLDPQATDGTGVAPPYGTCGGWQVVYSAPGNGISPFDPTVAGGLALDLASVGVSRAQYVKIVDLTHESCPEGGAGPDTNGFDLDAIAIVNAAIP
jgi:hypothetical protein